MNHRMVLTVTENRQLRKTVVFMTVRTETPREERMGQRRVLVAAVKDRNPLVGAFADVVVERRDHLLHRRRIDARAVEVLTDALHEDARDDSAVVVFEDGMHL